MIAGVNTEKRKVYLQLFRSIL